MSAAAGIPRRDTPLLGHTFVPPPNPADDDCRATTDEGIPCGWPLNEHPKSVWVLSWVYWNGDEQGGGGFVWFPDDYTEPGRLLHFRTEADGWRGTAVRVRLVLVPDVPAHLDGGVLTTYLDKVRLDDIERGLTAHRVYINDGRKK